MNIKNIDKLPMSVREILTAFVQKILCLFGDEVISVFVYGSVTGDDFNRKTSNINTAVVLEDISLRSLEKSMSTFKWGIRRNIPTPLFLTPEYIKMSLDTFPIEFIEMKETHCVVFGKDILADVEIKTEDLRRECEYQIKGKMLTIRQAYLEQASSRRGLEKIIKASFSSLIPVFRNMLRIKKQAPPPSTKREVLSEMGGEFGIDTDSFMEILKDKKDDGKIGNKPLKSLINDFLVQLEKLSKVVDRM